MPMGMGYPMKSGMMNSKHGMMMNHDPYNKSANMKIGMGTKTTMNNKMDYGKKGSSMKSMKY